MLCLIISVQQPLFSQTISTSIADLSIGADVIVTGKVIEQKAQWNTDKTMISTMVTLQVDESLKGSVSGNKITLTHPGGEVGSVGEYYSHIPKFTNDEMVLVFLKKHNDQNYRVFEGESGKFTLIEDDISGEKITSQHQKLSELKKEISRSLQRQ
jgi:hypothetical protein